LRLLRVVLAQAAIFKCAIFMVDYTVT